MDTGPAFPFILLSHAALVARPSNLTLISKATLTAVTADEMKPWYETGYTVASLKSILTELV
jgi:hypothetical protein